MRVLLSTFAVVLLGCLPQPAEPTLLSVEPALVDSNTGAPVLLTGTALLPRATLDFDRPDASVMASPEVSAWLIAPGGARVDLTAVIWLDATRVSGAVPANAPVGTWDVHLLAPRGQELVLTDALQVFDCTDVDCTLFDGGASDSGVVTCAELNYRDRDLDGFGTGAPANFCGAGWVARSGDCDDRDSLTHPQATELCNGLDDDCDGAIDEGGRCDGGWTGDDSLRGQGDLLVASSFAPGSFWTGGGAKLFVRRGELGLSEVGQACPASLAALWAADVTGEVEVAGATGNVGRVASHAPLASQCTAERLSGEPIVAMTGFELDGGALYVGVSRGGQLMRWERGGVVVSGATSNLSSDAVVSDLHGTAPDQLYAVGSTVVGQRRFAVWQLQRDGGWQAEPLSTVGDTKGELLALWVLAPGELVAVGREGLVLRKSAGVWRRLESDTDADLTSVRAFSAGRFYVSQSDGRVRRRAMNDWAVVFRADGGTRLNDLCGTGEEDLWVVGNGGVIGRGPHP